MIRHSGRRAAGDEEEDEGGWLDPRAGKTNLIPDSPDLFNLNYSLLAMDVLPGEAIDGGDAFHVVSGSATGNARAGHRIYDYLTIGNIYTLSCYLKLPVDGYNTQTHMWDAYNYNATLGNFGHFMGTTTEWGLLEVQYNAISDDLFVLFGSDFHVNEEFHMCLPMLYAGPKVT